MEKLLYIIKNKLRKNKKQLKKILNWLFLLLTISILIYFCIQDNNWQKILIITPKLNFYWILLSIIFLALSWYFDSLSILQILKFVEKKDFKKLKVYKITLIGQYFTSITPMGIGSPPAQTTELLKIDIPKNNAINIITAKFIIYQINLATYSLVCALIYLPFYNPQLPILYLIIGLISQLSFVAIVLLFMIFKNKIRRINLKNIKKIPIVQKYKKHLKNFKSSIANSANLTTSIFKNKALTFKLFAYGFIQISLLFAIPLLIFKAFNHNNFPALEMIQTQCVANTMCSFTPLPGNAGTSEKIFLTLFKNFFIGNEIAIAMIIHRIITFYLSIIIGSIVYFASNGHNN